MDIGDQVRIEGAVVASYEDGGVQYVRISQGGDVTVLVPASWVTVIAPAEPTSSPSPDQGTEPGGG